MIAYAWIMLALLVVGGFVASLVVVHALATLYGVIMDACD